MSANPIVGLWARTALIWFLITMCFGMYMGMTKQFHFSPSHAHMGVLGWLSAAAFAMLYAVAREAPGPSVAPRAHWAVHNIGVALMTGALFMMLREPGSFWGALIPIGGLVVIVGAVWLTVLLWGRLRPS